MKILILQLARLGDIYQTWPVVRAIKRLNPTAEVHFLTRTKFTSAAPTNLDDQDLVTRHWTMNTREILEPLIDERPQIGEALARMNALIEELREESFNKIINLSFSPFSSFFVQEISNLTTEIRGYTRTKDGYLAIPDDGSAYVYAQVGVGRPNRVHLTDLFAFVADAELTEADWSTLAPVELPKEDVFEALGENPIVVHVGASDPRKTLPWSKWLLVVKKLLEVQDRAVVLVGSASEYDLAVNICSGIGDGARAQGKTPVNLAGQTTLDQLFEVIRRASLLIGGDSAPIHIASLTGTPVLNLSYPLVSFWETGPRSSESRILEVPEVGISPAKIVDEALGILSGKSTLMPAVRVAGPMYPYIETRANPHHFSWDLVRALYMGADFPATDDPLFLTGLTRLMEVSTVAREQLTTLRRQGANTVATAILDQVMAVIEQIEKMVPAVSPLIRWFKTELLRIGPMPIEALIDATDAAYARLSEVAGLYIDAPPEISAQSTHAELKGDANDDANLG